MIYLSYDFVYDPDIFLKAQLLWEDNGSKYKTSLSNLYFLSVILYEHYHLSNWMVIYLTQIVSLLQRN